MTLFHGSFILPCISALSWYRTCFFHNISETFKPCVVIVNCHGPVILPYSINKAKRCIMLLFGLQVKFGLMFYKGRARCPVTSLILIFETEHTLF